MAVPRQQLRFCSSFDGTRIAFAISGSGPMLVAAPHWLTHLEFGWQSCHTGPWLERTSRSFTLLRSDQRGSGLSDRDVADISLEAMVRDLEAVVESCGWSRFALLGQSQGGAIAIEYAARHPDRVSQLVLHGAYARGRLVRGSALDTADLDAQIRMVEVGWGGEDPAYHEFFAARFMPDATLEQRLSMVAMQRASTSSENAVRIMRAVPFDEGRLLATLIPGARLVALDPRNHMRIEGDTAWETFFQEFDDFVPPDRPNPAAGAAALSARLTAREAEILERIAQGLDNAQIAAHLELSEKTVRNHITHIFDKIEVETRSKAILWARAAGFGQQTS